MKSYLQKAVTKLKIKDITDFLWTPEMKELTDALLHLNWRLTEQSDPAWVEKHEKNLLNTFPLEVLHGFELPQIDNFLDWE